MEETTTDTRKRKIEDMPEEERPRKMPAGDTHRPMETGFVEGLGKDVWCNILQHLEASELLGSVNLVNRKMRDYASFAFYMQASACLGPYFRDRVEFSLAADELAKVKHPGQFENPLDTPPPNNAWLVRGFLTGPLARVKGGEKEPLDKGPWFEHVRVGKSLVDSAVGDMRLILQSVSDTSCQKDKPNEYNSIFHSHLKIMVPRGAVREWLLADHAEDKEMDPRGADMRFARDKTSITRRVYIERSPSNMKPDLRDQPFLNPAMYHGKAADPDFPPEAITCLVDAVGASGGYYEAMTLGALKRLLEAASPYMSRFFREPSLLRSFHFSRSSFEGEKLRKIQPWCDRWLCTPRAYSLHTSLRPGIPAELPPYCTPSLVKLRQHTLSCPTCFAAQAYRILQFYEKGQLGWGGPLSEYLVLEGSPPNALADVWFRTTQENRNLPCLLEEKRSSRELPEGTCRWQMAFGLDPSQNKDPHWGEIWPLRMAVTWLCHREMAHRFLAVTPLWCRVNLPTIQRTGASSHYLFLSFPPPSPPAYYRNMTCAHLAAYRMAVSLDMEEPSRVHNVSDSWQLAFWLGHGEENAPQLSTATPLFPLDYFLSQVNIHDALTVMAQVRNRAQGRGPCDYSRAQFCQQLCILLCRAECYLQLRKLDFSSLLLQGVTCERLRVGDPKGRLSYLYHMLRHALSLLEEWNLGGAYVGKGLRTEDIQVLRETLSRCRKVVSDLRADLVEYLGEEATSCSTVDESAACTYLEKNRMDKLVPFQRASEDSKIAFWTVDITKRERVTSGNYSRVHREAMFFH